MRCVHGPCIAALHVLIALIVPGCVHVGLRFAVGVALSGVCMFHLLIVMFILVLNCEVLKCFVIIIIKINQPKRKRNKNKKLLYMPRPRHMNLFLLCL